MIKRISEVEDAYGDPWADANPTGFAALLASDDAEEVLPEAVRLYDHLGLNREFVPCDLGGGLQDLDTLGLVMRPLFRRDASLAVGCALTSFMGAVLVFLSGTEDQRRRVGDVLLAGGRVTIAFQRFEHDNDFVRDEFRAVRGTGSGFRFSGRKQAVNNVDTAEYLIAFAATGRGRDSGYSVFAVPPREVPPDTVTWLGRHHTPGGRGLRISGVDFDDCPLPSEALVGSWGGGLEMVLRTGLPAIHGTVPSMLVGMGDTALRTAARVARLAEPAAAERLPSHVRSALTGAFADLLAADCLAQTAARALHLVPEQSNVVAAAAKYLVSKLIGENMNDLSVVMGDQFHSQTGDNAIFRKHLRDLTTVTFGHVGSAVCQTTISPCLPHLAARPWSDQTPAPDALFRFEDELPPLDRDLLARFGDHDGLCAFLVNGSDTVRSAGVARGAAVDRALAFLARELDEFATACRRIGPDDGSASQESKLFPLTDRYVLLLMAASCLGVWLGQQGSDDPFLADSAWLEVSLDRIVRRLSRTGGPTATADSEAAVLAELAGRTRHGRSYDLLGVELAR